MQRVFYFSYKAVLKSKDLAWKISKFVGIGNRIIFHYENNNSLSVEPHPDLPPIFRTLSYDSFVNINALYSSGL